MLEYVHGHDQEIARFVAQRIPHCRRGFGQNVMAVGIIDEEGRLIAGIVYQNFDPDAGTIEISCAALPGKQWLTRETLKRMFRYPFFVCGCQMVVLRTPAENNEAFLYLLTRFGFDLIPMPRMFGREHDGVICLLTREAWEENRFNKRFRHHIPDALTTITYEAA